MTHAEQQSQPASLTESYTTINRHGRISLDIHFLKKNIFFGGGVSFRSPNCVTYRTLSVPTDQDISTPCRKRINNTRIRELLSLYHTDRNRGREGSLPHYQLVSRDIWCWTLSSQSSRPSRLRLPSNCSHHRSLSSGADNSTAN